MSTWVHPGFLVGSMLLIVLVFVCCPIMCLYVLSSVLWFPLRFQHENDVRYHFTSSCLYDDSCLIYVICVCLCKVVSNTYCVVLFCFRCFFPRCPPEKLKIIENKHRSTLEEQLRMANPETVATLGHKTQTTLNHKPQRHWAHKAQTKNNTIQIAKTWATWTTSKKQG